jgi:segregation and condensation protein B
MEEQERAAQQPGLNVPSSFKGLIEALVFAASEPLSLRQLKAICEAPTPEGADRQVDQEEIERALAELNEEYQRDDRAYRIVPIAGGFQFATLSEYAEWIGRLAREQSRRKLSQSAVETLAIIAYKQPISRPEIESIRGVNCEYVLRSLLEKDLVTITGRADTVGRPLLYGTTREFLQHFGLNLVTDLPRPREIEEILGETQFETDRRMLEAQAAADEAQKEVEDFKSRLPHIPKRKPDLDETAKIIPRRRQREITLKPTGEGPETIPPEMADDTPTNDLEPGMDVVEEAPASSESEAEATVPPATSGVDEGFTEPADEPEKARARTEEGISEVSGRADTGAQSPANDLVTPGGEAAPAGEAPAKSRWQTWKHRVREIIRKLFG